MIALILTIILSVIYARIIFSNVESAIYYFIPYNYLFDLIFFSADAGLATISTLVRVLILVIFFLRVSGKSFFKVRKPAYIFFVLLILILVISSLLSGSISKSFVETIKFGLIIFSFFVFFIYFNKNELNLKFFKRMVVHVALITIINIVLSNIFSFGWGGYSEDVGFYTGGIISNMWYVPALVILATIAAANLVKNESNLVLFICAIIVLLILIVALRRSAYIILAVGAVSTILFLKIRLRLIKIFVGIIIFGAACTPFFLPYLEKQITARSKTFDKGVDQESRLKETEVLWEERMETSPTFIFLFGEKPFDSTQNYGDGSFGDRPLHVDMNIIFFSSGFIGLILYSFFYITILAYYFRLIRRFARRTEMLRVYKYLFFSSFFSLIAMSFSGGLNAITFRMFGFLLVAIALGQIRYLLAQSKLKERESRILNQAYEIN